MNGTYSAKQRYKFWPDPLESADPSDGTFREGSQKTECTTGYGAGRLCRVSKVAIEISHRLVKSLDFRLYVKFLGI